MALKIGTFYAKTRDSKTYFEGTLKTRKLHDLGNITIEPNEKNQENEPDFLVITGQFEIGRAWKQTTKNSNREYLNVILDDPHMEEEIRARLVKQDEKHILLWERVSN